MVWTSCSSCSPASAGVAGTAAPRPRSPASGNGSAGRRPRRRGRERAPTRRASRARGATDARSSRSGRAAEARQVDPADARDAVVDHDELLVVTVERPLLGVERDVYADSPEALRDITEPPRRGPEERQGLQPRAARARPPSAQAPRAGRAGRGAPFHARAPSSVERIPAGDVDVRLGTRELLREPG